MSTLTTFDFYLPHKIIMEAGGENSEKMLSAV
jgi:hypothetical protein